MRIEPPTEIGADLLRCAFLKGGRCSGYLKCGTVETINGVACVTKELVHAFEVYMHVVRAPEETAPTALCVGFTDARRKVELRLCERACRSFSIRPEDAMESCFTGAPARRDVNVSPEAFEVWVIFAIQVLPAIPALEVHGQAVVERCLNQIPFENWGCRIISPR